VVRVRGGELRVGDAEGTVEKRSVFGGAVVLAVGVVVLNA
jgi:hypothetical protein